MYHPLLTTHTLVFKLLLLGCMFELWFAEHFDVSLGYDIHFVSVSLFMLRLMFLCFVFSLFNLSTQIVCK